MQQTNIKVTGKKLGKILDAFSLSELKGIAQNANIPVQKTKKAMVDLLVKNRIKLNQAIAITE